MQAVAEQHGPQQGVLREQLFPCTPAAVPEIRRLVRELWPEDQAAEQVVAELAGNAVLYGAHLCPNTFKVVLHSGDASGCRRIEVYDPNPEIPLLPVGRDAEGGLMDEGGRGLFLTMFFGQSLEFRRHHIGKVAIAILPPSETTS